MTRLATWILVGLLFLPNLAYAKIFLEDTNDTLQVVTASGVTTIHMYAAWADLTTTALTPGSSTARVTTATTTTLVASPGASTQRQIKGFSIRNNHASSSNAITIQFFDGTNATELLQYTLLAGETLQWGEDENFRVIDASGNVKGQVGLATGSNTIGSLTANQSVNVAQMNGVTTSMGVGASGTGTQRVASLIHDGTDTAQVTATSGGSLQVECAAGCSGGTQYAEDSIHASGDTLTLAGVVQQSADAALAADGDRTLLQVDATGYLKVINKNPNLATDNSTNSTSKVPVLAGVATTSAPTYTNTNQVPLSLNTSGGLRVDGSAVTQPVSGTVTANAGTNLNTSALLTTSAHDAAFGTAGTADTQVRTVQGIASMTPLLVNPGTAANHGLYTEDAASAGGETLNLAGAIRQDTPASSTSVDGDYANLKTDSVGRLWVNNSGVTQPVSGTVTVTQGTGTNLHIVCDSGCSGSGGTSAADNSAFTGGTTNVTPVGALYDTTPPAVTDGNIAAPRMDSNRYLYTNCVVGCSGGATTPADNFANPTDAGNSAAFNMVWDGATWDRAPGTSVDGLLVNLGANNDVTIQANASVNVAQMNGVATSMGNGTSGTGVQRVTIASDSTGQVALAAGSNTVGNVGVVPVTSGGLSISRTISAATTNSTNAKGSAGQVYGWYISNINAAARYVKFYNKATAPTCGTDTPVITLAIPGNTAGAGTNVNFAGGIAFGTGIGYCITTGSADNDTGAVAASDLIVNLFYK